MKKKLILFVTIIMAIALSVAMFTACDLIGGGDSNSDGNNDAPQTQNLNEAQCKAEFDAALAASVEKEDFCFIMTESGQGTFTTERKGDILHLSSFNTTISGANYDMYYYAKDGKYYYATKVEGSFVAEENESGYLNAMSRANLSSMASGVSLEADAAVTLPLTYTYEGVKNGKKVDITVTGEGTEGSNKLVVTTTVTIENGLIVSFRAVETTYIDDMPQIGGEDISVVLTYDQDVELPIELQ